MVRGPNLFAHLRGAIGGMAGVPGIEQSHGPNTGDRLADILHAARLFLAGGT